MRSGEPSRISLRKRWISPTLRARLKWFAGVIPIAQMLCTGWDIETFTWVVVTCVSFPIPFGNDRLGKTNKAVKYQPSKWGIEDT